MGRPADGAGALQLCRLPANQGELLGPVHDPFIRYRTFLSPRRSLRSPRCAASRMKTGMYHASGVVSPVKRAAIIGAELADRPFEDPLQLREGASGSEDQCRVWLASPTPGLLSSGCQQGRRELIESGGPRPRILMIEESPACWLQTPRTLRWESTRFHSSHLSDMVWTQ